MPKVELYNDHFQNFKRYNIPKAQLVIADIPYNLANNAYASNPQWYVDGDNSKGKSESLMSTATEKQLVIERAIAHRRCVEALTSIQAPLEVLRPVFKTAGHAKVLAQMDKIERWLDTCIKPLAAKKFGAKARDEFSQKNNFLAQTADMESMSHEERFRKWCALYMAGMFLLWDCRISCKQYADNQQWTYLDMTATTLGNMLMQMAPGCDEAGTAIYMHLHGYEWDTAEPQMKEAA